MKLSNAAFLNLCCILELVRTHFAACGGEDPPRLRGRSHFGEAKAREILKKRRSRTANNFKFFFGGKFFEKLKSLILCLTSSLDKFITKLLGSFSRERWQSSFRATTKYTIPSNRCAHPSRLDVKVRQSKYASQDTAIDINVLNAVVRNGYIFFVDNPKLLTETSVGEFIAIEAVSEFSPDEAQNEKGWNDKPQPIQEAERKLTSIIKTFTKTAQKRRAPNTQNYYWNGPTQNKTNEE